MTWSFLLTSLIVVASPGTGVLYTLAVALAHGSRASVAAAFGCTLGIVPHMIGAMLGLAAILHTSALVCSTAASPSMAASMCGRIPSVQPKAAAMLGRAPSVNATASV